MGRKFKLWLDSVDLDDIGISSDEFDEMHEEEKEEMFRGYAFANSDWGWEEQ